MKLCTKYWQVLCDQMTKIWKENVQICILVWWADFDALSICRIWNNLISIWNSHYACEKLSLKSRKNMKHSDESCIINERSVSNGNHQMNFIIIGRLSRFFDKCSHCWGFAYIHVFIFCGTIVILYTENKFSLASGTIPNKKHTITFCHKNLIRFFTTQDTKVPAEMWEKLLNALFYPYLKTYTQTWKQN